MKVELNLSDSLVSDIKEVMTHRRDEKSFNQTVVKLLEDGAYSALYHYARNKKVARQQKADKHLLAQLQSEVAELRAKKLQSEDDDIVARD